MPLFAALLADAGFSGVAVDTLRWRHEVAPSAWWSDIIEAGGPRFAIIAEQPPETSARIRSHYLRLTGRYDGAFPVCAHLAHAERSAGPDPDQR
ncbi:hypothetical protein ABZ297_36985 [Nonomuraea sp. NPDC005983]|uniref:hypothetical protein n=1 Tax=Nonomuraea sp. NPDC005983 TaxID=3155595 RepID=UPI0033B5AA13